MIHSSRELGSWLHARAAFLAAASAVALVLGGCGGGGGSSDADELIIPTVIEANVDTLATQIGGATQDVELYTVDNTDGSTTDWTLYTMANRFAATPVGMTKGAVTEITVPGYIPAHHGGEGLRRHELRPVVHRVARASAWWTSPTQRP